MFKETSVNISYRVRNILLHPKEEWCVIDKESTTTTGIYVNYIMPLAAIGPLASIIGMSLVGLQAPTGEIIRVPFGAAFAYAVISYALSLLAIYFIARWIDSLAPRFAGVTNLDQALKLTAYAATAGWLASIFALIPTFGFLAALGLYGIYLLYRGLPVMMKSPRENIARYTIFASLGAVAMFVLVHVISRVFIGFPAVVVTASLD
jgi:hypothetical protein